MALHVGNFFGFTGNLLFGRLVDTSREVTEIVDDRLSTASAGDARHQFFPSESGALPFPLLIALTLSYCAVFGFERFPVSALRCARRTLLLSQLRHSRRT